MAVTAEERSRTAVARHSEQTVERAIVLYLICGHSPGEAEKRLKAEGTPVSRMTITKWVNDRPELVDKLSEEVVPQAYARMAAMADEVALKIGQVEIGVIEQLHDKLGDLKPKEASAILKDLAVVKGINIDKGLLLRNRPTQIVEHRDVLKAMETLERLKVWPVQDSNEPAIAGGVGGRGYSRAPNLEKPVPALPSGPS